LFHHLVEKPSTGFLRIAKRKPPATASVPLDCWH
jgi:hypothetical protein